MRTSPDNRNEPRLKIVLFSPFLHLALIVVVGFIIYLPNLQAPLGFDSLAYIEQNTAVHNPRVLTDAGEIIREADSLSDTFKTGTVTRRLSVLTFALNYHLHGLKVFGYHLFNNLLHIANAVLVYYFALLLARRFYARGHAETTLQNRDKRQLLLFAFGCGILFTVHPLQTQAVTYVVQRFASLATFFYLLTLVLYLASSAVQGAKRRGALYLAAVIAAAGAMLCKEIAFTLPAVIVLLEVLFFSGAAMEKLRRIWPFLTTMSIIPYNLLQAKSIIARAGDLTGAMTNLAGHPQLSSSEYLFTQFRVIITYLRLLFLPAEQSLIYDYPVFSSFFAPQVLVSFLLIVTILLCALLFWKQAANVSTDHSWLLRLGAFGICWFFITLSVESSIIPIESVIYEHRVYLPSIGFFIAVVAGGTAVARRLTASTAASCLFPAIAALIVLSLAGATYARNTLWSDDIRFWEDVASKAPQNFRAHNNLGLRYHRIGQREKAEKAFLRAVELAPASESANLNLGILLNQTGRHQDAIKYLQVALRINPAAIKGWGALGNAYEGNRQPEQAVESYHEALKLDPDNVKTHINLGKLYHLQRQLDQAISHYRTAIDYDSKNFEARYNLGLALAETGRHAAAVDQYLEAMKLNPDFSRLHSSLGVAYYYLGEVQKAIEALQTAVQLDPGNARAKANLGKIRGTSGNASASP